MSAPILLPLERIVFDLIQHARARCGAGYGNYAVGLRHAIAQLLPLVTQDWRLWSEGQTIRETLADLDSRLSR